MRGCLLFGRNMTSAFDPADIPRWSSTTHPVFRRLGSEARPKVADRRSAGNCDITPI